MLTRKRNVLTRCNFADMLLLTITYHKPFAAGHPGIATNTLPSVNSELHTRFTGYTILPSSYFRTIAAQQFPLSPVNSNLVYFFPAQLYFPANPVHNKPQHSLKQARFARYTRNSDHLLPYRCAFPRHIYTSHCIHVTLCMQNITGAKASVHHRRL